MFFFVMDVVPNGLIFDSDSVLSYVLSKNSGKVSVQEALIVRG